MLAVRRTYCYNIFQLDRRCLCFRFMKKKLKETKFVDFLFIVLLYFTSIFFFIVVFVPTGSKISFSAVKTSAANITTSAGSGEKKENHFYIDKTSSYTIRRNKIDAAVSHNQKVTIKSINRRIVVPLGYYLTYLVRLRW